MEDKYCSNCKKFDDSDLNACWGREWDEACEDWESNIHNIATKEKRAHNKPSETEEI